MPTDVLCYIQPVPPEDQNGPITGYQVRYKTISQPAFSSLSVKGDTQESVNITGLSPWRLYTVTMAAETDAGIGQFSQTLTAKTAAEGILV